MKVIQVHAKRYKLKEELKNQLPPVLVTSDERPNQVSRFLNDANDRLIYDASPIHSLVSSEPHLTLHSLPAAPGPGHVVHPVHRLHAAGDPGEAAEEPEHGPQLQAAVPPAGPAGSAQLLPALQTAGHRR